MPLESLYDRIGVDYARGRRPDHRWQAEVDRALDQARTVLNVGAGTGSYEPADRFVLAVEPSATMIAQRPVAGPAVVQATAERLPLADAQFDVALALVTIHHWQDWRAGLREMQRVANRVIVLHFDPALHDRFWLVRDYLPAVAELSRDIPSVQAVSAELGDNVEVRTLPVPWNCVDGFLGAFWRRPRAYLDLAVQRSMSGLQLIDPRALARGLDQLRDDLEDGSWEQRNDNLLEVESLDLGWRLIATKQRPLSAG